MRRRFVAVLTASSLIFSTLSLTFFPSLVAAEGMNSENLAVDQTNELTLAYQGGVDSGTLTNVTVSGENPDTDHSFNVSKKEIKEALENISGLLDEDSALTMIKDSDSAAIITTESGATIDLPKDPSDAVVLSGQESLIQITLPQADGSKKSKKIEDGVIAYPGVDGSANAVTATADGVVKMLTIIDNTNAPLEYTYGIATPEGGTVELTQDGGAIVLNEVGETLAVIDTPWATDANGMGIATWYTTDGHNLTQHIIHNVEGVSYPVTADPSWLSWANVEKIAKCAFWIGVAVGGTYLGYKYVQGLGGAIYLARLMLAGAMSFTEFSRNLVAVAGYVSGINEIRNTCR